MIVWSIKLNPEDGINKKHSTKKLSAGLKIQIYLSEEGSPVLISQPNRAGHTQEGPPPPPRQTPINVSHSLTKITKQKNTQILRADSSVIRTADFLIQSEQSIEERLML